MSNKIVLSISIALCVMATFMFAGVIRQDGVKQVPNGLKLGGADQPYSYANISSANASTTRSTIVRGGAGILGAITVSSTSAQNIGIYDANAATTSGATLIGIIKASTAEQTLVYDVAVLNGITLDVPASYAGSMTVTYR